MRMIIAVLCVAFLLCSVVYADGKSQEDPWVVYHGSDGPGKGKHVVLISGDEEYRSEEALPQLAKILAVRHGFRCTVLFAINPETGAIDPNTVTNIPGLESLDKADLMVIATRSRNLPDEQMEHIDAFLKAGKPVIGMRTATHAFGHHKKPVITGKFAYYDNSYTGEIKAWEGGFGRAVLGEKWIRHHGRHKREGARGLIAPDAKDHPITQGIRDGEIWGPTDIYAVRLPLPGDSKPLVLGQVQQDIHYDPKDRWFGMKPTDPPLPKTHAKNNPMMPVAWIKSYQHPEGKKGTAFNTTMGAATDLESAGLRRLLVNAAYHLLGLDVPEKAKVDLVGEYKPTAYGFRGFKKGVMPADHRLDTTATKIEVENGQPLNVVYLMTDDQRWEHIGAYGGEVTTPALDALAAEGVVFDNAFYAVSICHPSRATILLGQYPNRHRYGFEEPCQQTISNAELAQSYPGMMRSAGYHTGFIGKFGVMVSQEKESTIVHGRRAFGQSKYYPTESFDYWAGWEGQAPQGEYWPTKNWGGPNAKKIEMGEPGKTHLTRLVGKHIEQFLTTRPKEKPFCLSVSYHAPKAITSSKKADSEYWPLFKDKMFELPGNYSAKTAAYVPRVVRENYRGTRHHLRKTGTSELFQNHMRIAATHAYSVDKTVERLVQVLKEQGVYDKTMIVYTSDNGFMYGDHGLYGKVLAYEGSMRAPLIVRDPRTPDRVRGTRSDALVSTVDFAPTFVTAAGLETPDRMQGLDLSPLLAGEKPDAWREAVLMVNNRSFHLTKSVTLRFPVVEEANDKQRAYLQENSQRFRAIRTKLWKYICFNELSPIKEQLFDLENDPLEQHDLAEEGRFAEQLAQMRKMCEQMYQQSK